MDKVKSTFSDDKNEQISKLENTVTSYKKVFQGSDGETVLKDIRKTVGQDSGNFSKDSHQHAFNEGMRALYCRIQNLVDTDLDLIREQIRQDLQKREELDNEW